MTIYCLSSFTLQICVKQSFIFSVGMYHVWNDSSLYLYGLFFIGTIVVRVNSVLY